MYFGMGPRIALNIDNFDTDDISFLGAETSYVKKSVNDRYQIGLTFSYGVELFFRKNFSLHAEYGFNISYFYQESTRIRITEYSGNPTRTDDYTMQSSGFEFDDTSALLGLSVYF